MTNAEIERRITEYPSRKARFQGAYEEGATRTNARTRGDKCATCRREEHGGSLFTYRLRDGSTLEVGGRCADYLDYLNANPGRARAIFR